MILFSGVSFLNSRLGILWYLTLSNFCLDIRLPVASSKLSENTLGLIYAYSWNKILLQFFQKPIFLHIIIKKNILKINFWLIMKLSINYICAVNITFSNIKIFISSKYIRDISTIFTSFKTGVQIVIIFRMYITFFLSFIIFFTVS